MGRFLPLILLVGCAAQPQPDYRSSSGVSYFWKTASWDPALIEATENSFLEGVLALPDFPAEKVMRSMSWTDVDVYGEKLVCAGSSTGYCNGDENWNVLRVRDLGCPQASALTHEMAHWLQQDVQGVYDSDHQAADLWALTGPSPCP